MSVKIAAGGLLAFGAFRVIKKGAEKREARRKLTVYQKSLTSYPVTDPISGQTAQITVDLSTSATKIYDAFYNNDPFGWTEDETAAINELKKIPKPFIPRLSKTYFDLFKKDLKGDFIKFLDTDEFDKIEYLFN